MAASLHSNLFFFIPANPNPSSIVLRAAPIRCGARGDRGPLLKGRVLSIEAIQAVQTLKRAHLRSTAAEESEHLDSLLSKTAARLIKADLVAAINELLRQNHCKLAGELFSAARSEPWYRTDLGMYASVATALARNGLGEDIDRLVRDLDGEGGGIPDARGGGGNAKGLLRLLRAVVEAERVESTVRIYEMLKKSGWGSSWGDEYVVKVLRRGFRRFGKEELADEVEREYENLCRANFRKLMV